MNLNDIPQMGIDYDGLAQIARPQMMPEAPLGAGALAGGRYGRDSARFDSLIDQARGEADMANKVKRQSAAEYLDPTAVDQRKSQRDDAAQSSQLDLKAKKMKLQQELDKEENKGIMEAANIFNDTQDITAATDHLRARGKTKFFNHEFGKDQAADAKVLQGIFSSQMNTPGHAAEMEKARVQVEKANVTGQYSVARQALSNQGKAQVAEMEAKFKSKQMNRSQWEAQMLDGMANGTLNPQQVATWQHYIAQQLAVASAREGNKPANIDVTNSGGINSRPPVIPRPAAIPGQPNAARGAITPAAQSQLGPILDLEKGVAFSNGKTIRITGQVKKNGEVVAYELEDGTRVPK